VKEMGNNESSFKTDPALPVPRKSMIPPQSTAKNVSAASNLLKTRTVLRFPLPHRDAKKRDP